MTYFRLEWSQKSGEPVLFSMSLEKGSKRSERVSLRSWDVWRGEDKLCTQRHSNSHFITKDDVAVHWGISICLGKFNLF